MILRPASCHRRKAEFRHIFLKVKPGRHRRHVHCRQEWRDRCITTCCGSSLTFVELNTELMRLNAVSFAVLTYEPAYTELISQAVLNTELMRLNAVSFAVLTYEHAYTELISQASLNISTANVYAAAAAAPAAPAPPVALFKRVKFKAGTHKLLKHRTKANRRKQP